MLHEILLSLSGFTSPFLQQVIDKTNDEADKSALVVLSPPEKALLSSLGQLSDLHVRLKEDIKGISAAHPSIVCRAVSTAISSEHLGRFQKKILEVERNILTKDAAYVGGYGIVPLSSMVGEFSPWSRRLEWLLKTTSFMRRSKNASAEQSDLCTGADVIDYLRTESNTGYQDLEELALSLVSTAEMVWIRQLSGWLLQGSLPSFGQADFLIQQEKPSNKNDRLPVFCIKHDLKPEFVSSQTARSILFIGRSLNHLRAQGNGLDAAQNLLPSHVELIRRLVGGPPIRSSDLAKVVSSVRASISKNILSQLLPVSKVRELLDVLQDFFLLRNGEFSVALVRSAVQSLRDRDESLVGGKALRKAGHLEGVTVKEAELITVLNDAWAEMEALQNEEDPFDDELELARDLLTLSTTCPYDSLSQDTSEDHCLTDCSASLQLFHDLLFPNPTYLSIMVQPPLDIFINASDIGVYSLTNAFLLGIRRAEMQLNGLWKHTSLRRSHPSPHGPPFSNSGSGESALLNRRKRENARLLNMRRHWVTAHSTAYILSELSAYFQGEVVEESWKHFRSWLGQFDPEDDTNMSSGLGASAMLDSRKDGKTSLSLGEEIERDTRRTQPDPETLTRAHRSYLSALVSSLLLASEEFCHALRTVLLLVQHYTALIARLHRVQRSLDLEEDEGVVDALADHSGEEKKILAEMDRSRTELETGSKQLIHSLQSLEDQQPNALPSGLEGLELDGSQYHPRRSAGLDRLMIKLDFMSSGDKSAQVKDDNPD